jgi:hypothetical protein
VGLFNRKLSGAMRRGKKAELDAWKLQWVGGMWFQDLWNYDFRRTEMCVIPYGTQEGEISFCAYNSGVGWRQIVENIHKVATTPEWYRTHGRHIIYAGDRAIPPSDPCPSPHTAVISGRRAAASAETPAKEATS